MSRIAALDPAHTEGKVKDMFDGVKKSVGVIPNLYRVTGQSPAALEGLLGLTSALGHGPLDPALRELISIAVAERNGCEYCLSAHTFLGKKAGLSDADLAQAREARAADAKAGAALRFVAQVLEQRGQVGDADLADVRRAGFSDGEIVEIIAHVALNIFTNTLNNVVQTDLDFPKVQPASRAA